MNFEVNTLYANRWIVEKKLVELTWGNVSLKDSKTGNIYIKPSGVSMMQAFLAIFSQSLISFSASSFVRCSTTSKAITISKEFSRKRFEMFFTFSQTGINGTLLSIFSK